MRSKVYYEWDFETVDENGDIIDHHHADKLKEIEHFRTGEEKGDFVLVRNVGNDMDGLVDRQWAYPVGGEMPSEFDGGAKVPQRYIKEWIIFTGEQA
jgi:hypothetical protein